jgi:hypothetical protein
MSEFSTTSGDFDSRFAEIVGHSLADLDTPVQRLGGLYIALSSIESLVFHRISPEGRLEIKNAGHTIAEQRKIFEVSDEIAKDQELAPRFCTHVSALYSTAYKVTDECLALTGAHLLGDVQDNRVEERCKSLAQWRATYSLTVRQNQIKSHFDTTDVGRLLIEHLLEMHHETISARLYTLQVQSRDKLPSVNAIQGGIGRRCVEEGILAALYLHVLREKDAEIAAFTATIPEDTSGLLPD